MSEKIDSFTNLIAWQKAKDLTLGVYQITKDFPREEIYSLTNQMRRAAISVASNIAEGFGRYSKKDKANFYTIAKGSLVELGNQIIISKDLKYLKEEECKDILFKVADCGKLVTGLIRSTKK